MQIMYVDWGADGADLKDSSPGALERNLARRERTHGPAPFGGFGSGCSVIHAERGGLANIPPLSALNLFLTYVKAKHIILAGAAQRGVVV